METYRQVLEKCEVAPDTLQIDGYQDIMSSGFDECSLYAISITKEGDKWPTFYKVRNILYTTRTGTCTVSPDGIDFVATLQTLLLGNVKSVLIIANGKESHIWGARYHSESGERWYHSNHEQGIMT